MKSVLVLVENIQVKKLIRRTHRSAYVHVFYYVVNVRYDDSETNLNFGYTGEYSLSILTAKTGRRSMKLLSHTDYSLTKTCRLTVAASLFWCRWFRTLGSVF